MSSIARRYVCWAAAMMVLPAAATAQEQSWRHGIIEPKGDAGFQYMSTRGGFAAKQNLKLELPIFQNDVIALRGLLAGELESYEGGAATAIIAGSRNADVKILGCHWQTVVHSVFARAELQVGAGPQGPYHGDLGAECDARHDRPRLSGAEQRAGSGGEVRLARQ